jgi:hypothetical protein
MEHKMTLQDITGQIRNGTLDIGGFHYPMGLAHGILQAACSGYNKITAIEFGVGPGGGFRNLLKAADFYRRHFNIEIEIYGFDNGVGLPDPVPGYKDHPEIWSQGQFVAANLEVWQTQLPPWAHFVVGDVKETVPVFCKEFAKGDSKVAFVSVDVDYYSSSVFALKILDMPPTCYVPAVPMHMDDVQSLITFSEYAGQELAIKEFNDAHKLRKIERKDHFRIQNFHVCHIFDHPIRTGEVKPLQPFEIHFDGPMSL